MPELLVEVERFRKWAEAYLPNRRSGEWECDYDSWDCLHDATLGFIGRHPFAEWSADETEAVLYIIARDNEIQHIAGDVGRRHPELLLPLTRAAIEHGESDARWQLV